MSKLYFYLSSPPNTSLYQSIVVGEGLCRGAAGATVRDSVLPLEGDTVQLLSVGAAASLPLPSLQPPRPQPRSPRELPGRARPAAPSPPRAQPFPAGELESRRNLIRGNLLLSAATCACAETLHPPPRRSEGERRGGEERRGEGREGRKGRAALCCAAPHLSVPWGRAGDGPATVCAGCGGGGERCQRSSAPRSD